MVAEAEAEGANDETVYDKNIILTYIKRWHFPNTVL
jgi:hypothetical protein